MKIYCVFFHLIKWNHFIFQSKSRSRSAEEETVPEGETYLTDILPANTDATSTDNMSDVAEEENNLNSDDIEEEDETVTEVSFSDITFPILCWKYIF